MDKLPSSVNCIHVMNSRNKENSVFCNKRGYVSPKWCEMCPDKKQD